MAKTEPGETDKLREILRARLMPRDNPFPPGRPAHLDDVVFLSAALSRLVIDPYREACATSTRIGERLKLELPFLFTGFDDASTETRQALAHALNAGGCAYVGVRPLAQDVPWLQLVVRGKSEAHPGAAGLIHVVGAKFEPIKPERLSDNQLLGMAVAAPALPEVVPYALENGFDFLLLDGTRGIEIPWVELDGSPDLTVVRDAIEILRSLNQEEELALFYYGGLRTGTDVAKMLAMNCNAGVFGVAMCLVLGGTMRDGQLDFDNSRSAEELSEAAESWIKATAQETAIIARCAGKTNVHNLEPEDMRTITLATSEALGVPLAAGREAREYF